jgi:hypothetical protein
VSVVFRASRAEIRNDVALTARKVADWVLGDDVDAAEIVTRLRADGDAAETILRELAGSRNVDLRNGVTWAAPRTLPRDAATNLLLALARDRDPDVSDDAIAALVDHDPETAAARLKPLLRRKLRSPDIYEPVAAMWKLAAIDPDAADEIRLAANESEYPFHRRVAEAVCLWLAKDVDELRRRILVEDESAEHLVIAAEKLNDPALNHVVADWMKRAEERTRS